MERFPRLTSPWWYVSILCGASKVWNLLLLHSFWDITHVGID
jgi:hypothetical protein